MFASDLVGFGQFTALVGLHGAGKTYMLHMLHAVLPQHQTRTNLPIETTFGDHGALRGDYDVSVRSGETYTDVSVIRPLPERLYHHNVTARLAPLSSTMLSPYAAQNELAYHSDNMLGEPPVIDAEPLNRRELNALSAITGHRYESMEYGWFDQRQHDEWFPSFSGTRGGVRVDSWSMSNSEFWVHWVLSTLRTSEPDDLVLIDEPETFLAEPGHRAFLEEIARLALASGCQVVVATHSDAMIRHIPTNCIRLITGEPGQATFATVRDVESILRALSRDAPRVSTLVFVEDALAASMTRAILDRLGHSRVDEIDVIAAGGESRVIAATQVVGQSTRVEARGVLDGDQRCSKTQDRIGFLPGSTAPEDELARILEDRCADVAARMDADPASLRAALASARFEPHQRLFDSISRSLGRHSAETIKDLTIEFWLEDPSIREQAVDLAHWIAPPGKN